jgi:hypothetical protein
MLTSVAAVSATAYTAMIIQNSIEFSVIQIHEERRVTMHVTQSIKCQDTDYAVILLLQIT